MKERLLWVYRRANELLSEYGLKEQGWVFQVRNTTSLVGQCDYNKKVIHFSGHYLLKTPVEEIEDTLLHEIAHALCGFDAGHGPIWKAKAIEVGARPQRCADERSISTAKPNYVIRCENCGWSVERFRMRRRNFGSTCPRCQTEVKIYKIKRRVKR